MVYVIIGASEVPREQATPGWVTEQLNRRRDDGRSVCVQVRIATADVRVTLATPQCGGGGGGRQANPRERRVIDLWTDRVLKHAEATPGHITSFLHQLDNLL
jgi:hypothetical protein